MTTKKTLYANVSLAYGTKQELTQLNETYNKDVPIFEMDEDLGLVRMKMGNGATPYLDLPYVLEYSLKKDLLDLLINAGTPGGVAIIDKNGVIDPGILGDTTLSTNDTIIIKSGGAADAAALYAAVNS